MSKQIHLDSKQEKPDKSWLAWVGEIAALLSIMGLVLSLSGYGVALAAENKFGIPHAALFSSPLDLLDLSSWAVMNVLTGVVELLNNLGFYIRLLTGAGPLLLGVTVLWVLIVLVGTYLSKNPNNFIFRITAYIKSPLTRQERPSTRALLVFGPLLGLVGATSATLVSVVLLTAVALMCFLISFLPIFAMAAGQVHIRHYVIEPDHCYGVYDRALRMKPVVTTGEQKRQLVVSCVRVLNGDKEELGSGRVVFSTSSSVLLWNSKTGNVRRVPLEANVLEVLPKE